MALNNMNPSISNSPAAAPKGQPSDFSVPPDLEILPGSRSVSSPRSHPKTYTMSQLPIPLKNDTNVLLGRGAGLLRKAGSMIIAGETGIGKSVLLMHFALCLALGVPFFGICVPRRLRVLLVTAIVEDDAHILWQHSHGVAATIGLTPEQLAVVDSNLLMAPLHPGAASLVEAAGLAQAHQADVVCINPLYQFATGHLGDIHVAHELTTHQLSELIQTTGAAIVAIHHMPKHVGSEKGDSWGSSRGSGAGAQMVFDFFRTSLTLRAKGSVRGVAVLKFAKGAERSGLDSTEIPLEWSKREEVIFGGQQVEKLGWLVSTPKPRDEEPESETMPLWNLIRELLTPTGTRLALGELHQRINAAGRTISVSTLDRYLAKCRSTQSVVITKDGKRNLFSLPTEPGDSTPNTTEES